MKKYILHRLLYLIPILLGITLFTFILLHSTNDIVDIMELNRGVVYSEATKTQIRQDLGLDQPIFIQYLNWLLSIAIWELLPFLEKMFLLCFLINCHRLYI